MLQLLIVRLGRTLPLTSRYRPRRRSSLATSKSLLGVRIFSMNAGAQRGGGQRAGLQTPRALGNRLGAGAGAGAAPPATGAVCCLRHGAGQRLLVCHPRPSGTERTPRASLVRRLWLLFTRPWGGGGVSPFFRAMLTAEGWGTERQQR